MAEENASSILGNLDSLLSDPKATHDYTAEVQDVCEKANLLANKGLIEDAIQEIFNFEKKTRQACDSTSSITLCLCALQIIKNQNDIKKFQEIVVLLCKKRGQLKKVIVEMVQFGMRWIEELESVAIKKECIEILSHVTNGKIFVEVERARLTRMLAKIYEDDGKLEEAVKLLQELQIETFEGMEKREKTEYILDQMRLSLLLKDYIRCGIISKRIVPKRLEVTEFQDLKQQYFKYLIDYFLHEEEYLEVCKCYHSLLHTPCVQENNEKWKEILQFYIMFMLLAPYNNTQWEMLEKVKKEENKKFKEMPLLRDIVNSFLTLELIRWHLPNEDALRKLPIFENSPHPRGEHRWEVFLKRIIQHDIKVIGTYYSQIQLDRLATLLHTNSEECESHIAELVGLNFLSAKIDRPSRLVTFTKSLDPCEKLNAWTSDIDGILNLVNESIHLIQKERMLQENRKNC